MKGSKLLVLNKIESRQSKFPAKHWHLTSPASPRLSSTTYEGNYFPCPSPDIVDLSQMKVNSSSLRQCIIFRRGRTDQLSNLDIILLSCFLSPNLINPSPKSNIRLQYVTSLIKMRELLERGETQRDTMRKYFEQFGEILEAVVITDKATGRSKGYGFVTFKDPKAAFRACQNPAPVIDGRKANCNLASLGAQKNRPPAAAAAPHQVGSGQGWFRAGAGPGLVAPPAAFAAASPYFQLQQSAPQQLTFPYSAYGYTGFSHDATMYPMSYYGVYGGQNLSPYYTSAGGGGGGGSGAGGYFHNYYPYYAAYAASQGSQAQQQQQQHGGYGVHQYHHPHMLQYSSYLPGQHQHSSGILSLPTSLALPPPPPTSSGLVATATGGAGGGGGASSAVSEHNSSST